jgi:YaiO family outer membrane protein
MLLSARRLIAGLGLLSLVCSPLVAMTQFARAGELDLSGNLTSLTSPDNNVGPWQSLTLSDREQLGKDKPGIAIVDRSDDDAGGPGHSLGIVLDDYHDWSERFFTYASIGASAGTVLPTRQAFVEGDLKLGKSMTTVAGLGAGVVVNPDRTINRYLNFGPTYYHNNMNASLRILPSFTTGRMGATTAIGTYANGEVGKTVMTITAIAGSEPPYGFIAASSLASSTGQRVVYGGIDFKHWTSPKGGFHIGIEAERLNDRISGTTLYAGRGINVGIFRQVGPGPAP